MHRLSIKKLREAVKGGINFNSFKNLLFIEKDIELPLLDELCSTLDLLINENEGDLSLLYAMAKYDLNMYVRHLINRCSRGEHRGILALFDDYLFDDYMSEKVLKEEFKNLFKFMVKLGFAYAKPNHQNLFHVVARKYPALMPELIKICPGYVLKMINDYCVFEGDEFYKDSNFVAYTPIMTLARFCN